MLITSLLTLVVICLFIVALATQHSKKYARLNKIAFYTCITVGFIWVFWIVGSTMLNPGARGAMEGITSVFPQWP